MHWYILIAIKLDRCHWHLFAAVSTEQQFLTSFILSLNENNKRTLALN